MSALHLAVPSSAHTTAHYVTHHPPARTHTPSNAQTHKHNTIHTERDADGWRPGFLDSFYREKKDALRRGRSVSVLALRGCLLPVCAHVGGWVGRVRVVCVCAGVAWLPACLRARMSVWMGG